MGNKRKEKKRKSMITFKTYVGYKKVTESERILNKHLERHESKSKALQLEESLSIHVGETNALRNLEHEIGSKETSALNDEQREFIKGTPIRRSCRPSIIRQPGTLRLIIPKEILSTTVEDIKKSRLSKLNSPDEMSHALLDDDDSASMALDDDYDGRDTVSYCLSKQRTSNSLQSWELSSRKRNSTHNRRFSVSIKSRSKRSVNGIVASLNDESLQSLSQIFNSQLSLIHDNDDDDDDDENNDCVNNSINNEASRNNEKKKDYKDKLNFYGEAIDKVQQEMRTFKNSIFNSQMATQIMNVRKKDWLSSLLRLDPRWQIMTYFNDVTQAGAAEIETKGLDKMALSPLLKMFSRAHVVSVWRPTSSIAIKRMMMGEAVGKGLDIKGKSAKEGLLSGYVPFLQIHSNEEDKKKISTLPSHSRIRVFFKTAHERQKAVSNLRKTLSFMLEKSKSCRKIIETESKNYDQYEVALKDKMNKMDNPEIIIIDDYAPKSFGIDIPDRLFLKAFILDKNINREKGTPMFTGRPSEPAFQDMNFAATRKEKKYGAKAVVQQFGGHDDNDPLCPLTLVMAYEENDRVLPVVSDFDCFLVCTKGVEFKLPIASDQIEVMKRTVRQIGEILDDEKTRMNSWTENWLQMLKKNSLSVFKPKMPKYGYGDPKTYSIMENAISRLKSNGAVRHGSECFNYFFPQEMEEKFLVISSEFNGNPWKSLTLHELQDYLCSLINQGFTLPLNLKWILCDKGWKKVYDKLLSSQFPHVQNSLNIWYPPQSGIREQIEKIHSKHPNGFETKNHSNNESLLSDDPSHAADLAKLKLKRYMALQRAKRKLKTVMALRNIAKEARIRDNKQREISVSEKKIIDQF